MMRGLASAAAGSSARSRATRSGTNPIPAHRRECAPASAHPCETGRMTTSAIPFGRLEDAPADLRERIEAIAEKTGFVPNVFLALLHRPDECRAFMDYHAAVMERESGLSKAE